jgi:hypothetical protein
MRISRFASLTLGVLAVAQVFTGCVAGGPQSGALGHNELIPTQPAAAGIAAPAGIFKNVMTGVRERDHRRSWISQDIESTHKLLFVSDASGVVWIYKMPSLEIKGILTGFQAVNGMCSDGKGSVWVAMSGFEQMWKLAHDGSIVRILQDTIGTPIGCAVDPTSGNLAVSNAANNTDSSHIGGSILVYPGAAGDPAEYWCVSCLISYGFAGYDTNGNLFVDGKNASNVFALAELPAGSSTTNQLKAINIEGGTLYDPGMVEWDAARHYLVIGDQSCGNERATCVYRAKIFGSTAKITGRTTLLDSAGNPICDMIQGTLDGNTIAGSDYDGGSCGHPSGTDLWPFPAGGQATHYNDIYDSDPVGAAISQK